MILWIHAPYLFRLRSEACPGELLAEALCLPMQMTTNMLSQRVGGRPFVLKVQAAVRLPHVIAVAQAKTQPWGE